MIKNNEYFDGKVKSLGFENTNGRATVGVMEPGQYAFSTEAPEHMTLISGSWTLKLPGSDRFMNFALGVTAEIPANSRFELNIEVQSAYLCEFK